MEENKERNEINLTEHLFVYEDDPYKVMYKGRDGKGYWLKFITNAAASELLTPEERETVKQHRSLMNAIDSSPEELYNEEKVKEELGKIFPKYAEVFPISQTNPPQTEQKGADQSPQQPSLPDLPKSREEAMRRKLNTKDDQVMPETFVPKNTETFGAIQIGDMLITEQDIDQLSKIPKLLNRIYQNVMQEGTDYGVIPGAGDKPTLLKPGAELLRMAFNLRYESEMEVAIEDWEKGMFYYRVKSYFTNTQGQRIGTGVGSANSLESRYSNRWVFESEIPDGIDRASLKSQERTSKKGMKYRVYLIEADIHEKATLVNTLQKMAKKRSFVDGILSITGASRIFTQDIEDLKVS